MKKEEVMKKGERGSLRERPKGWGVAVTLLVLVIACKTSRAQDEFDGLMCGADIPKALIGKPDSNSRVAVIEGRHKELGLKNLGGTEISDRLFLASWRICGTEYELLVNTETRRVRDVLQFPAHSKASPMFIGICHVAGKVNPSTVLAVLDNRSGYDARDEKVARTMLKAMTAWRIDQAKENFATQATDKLACPLGGVVTQDGGP